MKAYYAHPMTIYDRPQEKRDLKTIEGLGLEPVNPNAPESQAGYDNEGMAYFARIVRQCDVLVFRAFPDGTIPAGVVNEIEVAEAHGLPLIELPTNRCVRSLDVAATRERLREGGLR